MSIIPPVGHHMVSAVCPRCGSRHCQLQSSARNAGIVAGGILGAIIAVGFSGDELGSANDMPVASSSSSPLAMIAEVIGIAIVGFTLGAIAGHALGTDVDKNVLRLYRCLECGVEFKA